MAAYLIGGGIVLIIARNLLYKESVAKKNFYWIHENQRKLETLGGASHINYTMPQFVARYFGQVTPYKHKQSDWFAQRMQTGLDAFDHENKSNHVRGAHARINNLGLIRKGPRGFATQVRPHISFG